MRAGAARGVADAVVSDDEFYPRMIALCVGCAISFIRDYAPDDPKERQAIARRVGRTMVDMVMDGLPPEATANSEKP